MNAKRKKCMRKRKSDKPTIKFGDTPSMDARHIIKTSLHSLICIFTVTLNDIRLCIRSATKICTCRVSYDRFDNARLPPAFSIKRVCDRVLSIMVQQGSTYDTSKGMIQRCGGNSQEEKDSEGTFDIDHLQFYLSALCKRMKFVFMITAREENLSGIDTTSKIFANTFALRTA
jgi:hypothetical protein